MTMNRRAFFRASAVTAAGLYVAPEILDRPERRIWPVGIDLKAAPIKKLTGVKMHRLASCVVSVRADRRESYSASCRDPIGYATGPVYAEVHFSDSPDVERLPVEEVAPGWYRVELGAESIVAREESMTQAEVVRTYDYDCGHSMTWQMDRRVSVEQMRSMLGLPLEGRR